MAEKARKEVTPVVAAADAGADADAFVVVDDVVVGVVDVVVDAVVDVVVDDDAVKYSFWTRECSKCYFVLENTSSQRVE